MKKLAIALLALSLSPAVTFAQAGPAPGAGKGPGAGRGGPATPDDATRLQRAQKRMRLAATLGLAEALDLDDAGALRVRDVLARNAEKRMAVQRQVRDNLRILRDAAQGDQTAGGQVDAALGKLKDARAQRQALDYDLLQQITQGLSPEKKARAALFLARFRERASHMAMRRGGPGGFGPGRFGHGMGPGPRRAMDDGAPGPGFGPGQPGGPGSLREGPATAMSDAPGEPELESWFGEE